jgi:hypothetical protein
MQAKLASTPPKGFQPVSITLTFDTQKELQAFYDVTNWAYQAAEAVSRNSRFNTTQSISKVLRDMWSAVYSIGGWKGCNDNW